MIDLQKKIPTNSSFFPTRDWRSRRARKERQLVVSGKDSGQGEQKWQRTRKRSLSTGSAGDELTGDSNFIICLRYNAMIFLDFIDANEMVVVEQPWSPIFESLPDPLVSRTFGLA